MTWEEARRSIYPLPVASVAVDLDFGPVGPCVACGYTAETGYHGRPFHMLCAVELAFYVELVRRGERAPIALPSGFLLDAGSADSLELPVGR